MPPEAGFRCDLAGAVATITLNRPEKLNAQNPHTWTWLARVAGALPGTVRVIVLRGEGRAFSAGLDRAMFSAEGIDGAPSVLALAHGPAERVTAQIATWQRAFDWRSRPALISVAAVQGHAIGAGFQLALGADIRIAAEDAEFTMAEPSLGLVPDLGGTKRLVDLVGYSRAAEICLTGRRVGAVEALAIGLVSTVVPLNELEVAVERSVAALLAVDRDSSAETKALLLAAAARSQPEQEAAERDAQYRLLRALTGADAGEQRPA